MRLPEDLQKMLETNWEVWEAITRDQETKVIMRRYWETVPNKRKITGVTGTSGGLVER